MHNIRELCLSIINIKKQCLYIRNSDTNTEKNIKAKKMTTQE